ncbi:CLUMA_CG007613, isoform A [Clunio marinus]|uniref:CLUMA_CG007613, isoform A n=1 Tax=Clunio marinus TaxID=568069 RepID=A0A1J1I2U8_9DIPT|nr:CLUMA_CG007613, isoform A [Clunio marinus]
MFWKFARCFAMLRSQLHLWVEQTLHKLRFMRTLHVLLTGKRSIDLGGFCKAKPKIFFFIPQLLHD